MNKRNTPGNLQEAVTVERYLTPPQIAKMLSVKNDKVWGWINSGKLKAVNLSCGNEQPRWKIKPSDLEEFLATKSNQVNSPSVDNRRKNLKKPPSMIV